MLNDSRQDFLFLSELVHSGDYNIKIGWGDVFGVPEQVLGAFIGGRSSLDRPPASPGF